MLTDDYACYYIMDSLVLLIAQIVIYNRFQRRIIEPSLRA